MDITGKFLMLAIENERLHHIMRKILKKIDKLDEENKNLKETV